MAQGNGTRTGRATPSRTWFRFYHETLLDRKVRSLSYGERWLWVAILTAASESPIRGLLLITDDEPVSERHLASMADMRVSEVKKGLPKLLNRSMISWNEEMDCWQVVKWDDRQFESDSSTERTRKYREAKRNRTSRERSGDVTGNVPGDGLGTATESREQRADVCTDPQQQQTAVEGGGLPGAAAAETLKNAFEVIYQRRHYAPTNPAGHKRHVIAQFPKDFADEIARINWSVDWTPELLADWLEPVRKPQLSVVPPSGPATPPSPAHYPFHPLSCEYCGGMETSKDCVAPMEEGA